MASIQRLTLVLGLILLGFCGIQADEKSEAVKWLTQTHTSRTWSWTYHGEVKHSTETLGKWDAQENLDWAKSHQSIIKQNPNDIIFHLANGDGPCPNGVYRNSNVHLVCDSRARWSRVEHSEPTMCHYVIKVISKHVCAIKKYNLIQDAAGGGACADIEYDAFCGLLKDNYKLCGTQGDDCKKTCGKC